MGRSAKRTENQISKSRETQTAPPTLLSANFGNVAPLGVTLRFRFGLIVGLLGHTSASQHSCNSPISGFTRHLHSSSNASYTWDLNTPSPTGRTLQERSAYPFWSATSSPSEAQAPSWRLMNSNSASARLNQGRRVDGAWIFGGIERDNPERSLLVCIADRTAATLIPLIKQYIKPGTRILSDRLQSYNQLEKEGFVHETVNHSIEFVSENDVHTQTIKFTWRTVTPPHSTEQR